MPICTKSKLILYKTAAVGVLTKQVDIFQSYQFGFFPQLSLHHSCAKKWFKYAHMGMSVLYEDRLEKSEPTL